MPDESPPADLPPGWTLVRLAGRVFRAHDFDHPDVQARVGQDMAAGVDVYYDRRFRLTSHFCRWVDAHPGAVADRTVLVAGAGVGLEAVVLGGRAAAVVVNDVAPTALDLAVEQLAANGVHDVRTAPGPCQDVDLDGVDLVVACFVVYDADTRDAVAGLVRRASRRGVPALLANEDIGGFFDEVLDALDAPVHELARPGRGRIVWVGPDPPVDPTA